MTKGRTIKLKDVGEHNLFRCCSNRSCHHPILQVSHYLGGNRVVVTLPNKQIFGIGDFTIFSGDKEVYVEGE